jgi:hypothetical protein
MVNLAHQLDWVEKCLNKLNTLWCVCEGVSRDDNILIYCSAEALRPSTQPLTGISVYIVTVPLTPSWPGSH